MWGAVCWNRVNKVTCSSAATSDCFYICEETVSKAGEALLIQQIASRNIWKHWVCVGGSEDSPPPHCDKAPVVNEDDIFMSHLKSQLLEDKSRLSEPVEAEEMATDIQEQPERLVISMRSHSFKRKQKTQREKVCLEVKRGKNPGRGYFTLPWKKGSMTRVPMRRTPTLWADEKFTQV